MMMSELIKDYINDLDNDEKKDILYRSLARTGPVMWGGTIYFAASDNGQAYVGMILRVGVAAYTEAPDLSIPWDEDHIVMSYSGEYPI